MKIVTPFMRTMAHSLRLFRRLPLLSNACFKRQLNVVPVRLCSGKIDREVCRFPTPEKSSLPQDIQNVMNEQEEKGGFVPNVFKVLSRRPDEFRAFFAYYDALMNKTTGNLTKADREMIVVATSAENGCLYCVVAHSALHRIYSKNTTCADQIATNWQCAELTDRQRAILEFAIDVCQAEPISEEHFRELEEHGLDREDAWDIAAITALFGLSNRMALTTDMRPNKEFYMIGRVPKEKGKKDHSRN